MGGHMKFTKRSNKKYRSYLKRLEKKKQSTRGRSEGKGNGRVSYSVGKAFNPARMRCAECMISTYVKGVSRKGNRVRITFDCNHSVNINTVR